MHAVVGLGNKRVSKKCIPISMFHFEDIAVGAILFLVVVDTCSGNFKTSRGMKTVVLVFTVLLCNLLGLISIA